MFETREFAKLRLTKFHGFTRVANFWNGRDVWKHNLAANTGDITFISAVFNYAHSFSYRFYRRKSLEKNCWMQNSFY